MIWGQVLEGHSDKRKRTNTLSGKRHTVNTAKNGRAHLLAFAALLKSEITHRKPACWLFTID